MCNFRCDLVSYIWVITNWDWELGCPKSLVKRSPVTNLLATQSWSSWWLKMSQHPTTSKLTKPLVGTSLTTNLGMFHQHSALRSLLYTPANWVIFGYQWHVVKFDEKTNKQNLQVNHEQNAKLVNVKHFGHLVKASMCFSCFCHQWFGMALVKQIRKPTNNIRFP